MPEGDGTTPIAATCVRVLVGVTLSCVIALPTAHACPADKEVRLYDATIARIEELRSQLDQAAQGERKELKEQIEALQALAEKYFRVIVGCR